MSKSVLISIQPKWCELILRGEKTIEVRKTKPKLALPFKCYIYQSKGRDRLIEVMKDGDLNYGEIYHGKPVFIKTTAYESGYKGLFGRKQKIVGEFVCDNIEWIGQSSLVVKEDADKALAGSCLTREDVFKYLGLPRKQDDNKYRECYGWHISDLKIYDKPKELCEFRKPCIYPKMPYCPTCPVGYEYISETEEEFYVCDGECNTEWVCQNYLKKAPQSWCYVEEREDNAKGL